MSAAMPPPNTPEEGVLAPTAVPEPQRHSSRRSSASASTTPAATLRSGSPGNPSSESRPPESNNILPLDYQALEYAQQVDSTLVCPICHTPFYLPLTTRKCGHTFCTDCIHRSLEHQPVCPNDRLPIDSDQDLYQTRIIIDQLDRLQVRCPNKGCDQICARDRLPAHYERYCEHTLVPCPDPDCNRRIPRKDSRSEKGCLHKNIPCQYCGVDVMLAELEEHYDNSCSDNTSKCSLCAAMVVRHRMERHLSSECPEAEVHCESSPYGCMVFAKRKVVEEHEQRGCVYQAIGKLMRDRMEDRNVINELRGRIHSLERRLEYRGGLLPHAGGEASSSSASAAAGFVPNLDLDLSNSPRAAPMPWNHHNGSLDDYMLAQFERMDNKLEDLRKAMLERDGYRDMRILNDTMRMNEQIAELGSKVGVLGMHTTWLMNVQRQSRVFQRTAGATTGSPGGGLGGPVGGGMSTNGSNSSRNSTDGGDDGRHAHANHLPPPRRNSVGRGENPPRL